MSKKKEVSLHRCGDCANVTPVLDRFHLLDLRGNPIMGTCPFWTDSRSTLLSWLSNCPHFKPSKHLQQ